MSKNNSKQNGSNGSKGSNLSDKFRSYPLAYRPDPEDPRDYKFSIKSPLTLSESHDLRQYSREIENQGTVGSCVGNATSSCLELYAKSKLSTDKNFSRLFIYYNARVLGNIQGDEGAYLRDGIKSCNISGICEENFWDYDTDEVNTEPSSDAYQEARKNRAVRYERIDKTKRDDIKTAILNGTSVILGMSLSDGFYDITGPLDTHNYTGVDQDHPSIGGHAMNIVGYDNNLGQGSWIVENSWGTDFGDQGYFALPYTVYERDGEDLWCCTELKIDMASTDPDYINLDPDPLPDPVPIDELITQAVQKAKDFFNGPQGADKTAKELRRERLKNRLKS